MLGKKEPIKVASVSSAFAPPEEVELPNGQVVPVRMLDAIGYELWQQIETEPDRYGSRIWDLVKACLPSVDDETIKHLTPTECGLIVLIAAGRIKEVQALADKMEGNAEAPTMGAPLEPTTSKTPSDSSSSASPEISGAT